MGYISREGAYSESSLVDERGELYYRGETILDKNEIQEWKKSLREEYSYERRMIFSPADPDMSKEDLLSVVRDSIDKHQMETGKNYEFFVSVHDHNGRIHAHVVCFSEDKEDIAMHREEINSMREHANQLELEKIEERTLELEEYKSIDLDLDKGGQKEWEQGLEF